MEYQETFHIASREETRLEQRISFRKKKVFDMLLSIGGMVIANILLYQAVQKPALWLQILVCAGGALVMFGLIFLLDMLVADFLVGRDYAHGLRRNYTQTLRFDGFGIHRIIGKKEEKLPYDKIYQVQETDRAIYIFYNASKAWILPKNQMQHPTEDLPLLRKTLTTLVEKSRLLLL